METVDVRGLSCPIPVIRTKKVIDAGSKSILVIGNTEVSKENVQRLAKSQGYQINLRSDSKEQWELELSK